MHASPATITPAKMLLANRQQRLADIAKQSCWDIVIIGGGITGAGILHLASQLGLKVLLLEQKDFAWGSSSRSSKMVHGGLRYLAQGQFGLARDSIKARQRLLNDGEPLINKQSFVMSHYQGQFPSPWLFKQLLTCYDWIAGKNQHQFWHKQSFLALAPYVPNEQLLGGTQFFDALTDDARLVLRLIQEAIQRGGQAINYAEVICVNKLDKAHVAAPGYQVKLQCEEHSAPLWINSKLVINATGAWANQLSSPELKTRPPKVYMRPLRGSHLILPSWRLPVASVVSIRHPHDKRPVQIYPWQNVTVVGTTDVEHHQPLTEEAGISQLEFDYLLAAVAQQFPSANISASDVISSYAGVRPVITKQQNQPPSKENREHYIEQQAGYILVTGGKLTTFKLIAEQVLTIANSLLANVEQPLSSVEKNFSPLASLSSCVHKLPFSAMCNQQLAAVYGELASYVANHFDHANYSAISYSKHLWIELLWSVKHEQVQHLDDLMLRRTRLGNVLPYGGKAILGQVQGLCQPYLNWNEQRWQQEISRYLSLWQQHYSLPKTTNLSST